MNGLGGRFEPWTIDDTSAQHVRTVTVSIVRQVARLIEQRTLVCAVCCPHKIDGGQNDLVKS